MRSPAGPAQSVSEALSFWAASTPDAPALLAPEREPATYRDLGDAVARLASELRALGVGREDGVALLFPDGPDLCLALLATIAVGIAVPLAWPNPPAAYRRVLASRRVRAVMISAAIPWAGLDLADLELPVITLASGATGRLRDVRVEGQPFGEPTPAGLPRPDDIAQILHSSGTTGRPKLVPRLHRNSAATCRAIIAARALTSADRGLSLSPTAYSQGQIILMTAVFSGGSLVSVPAPDLSAMPAWLRTYRPTYVSTTPAVLRALAAAGGTLGEAFRHAALRCILSSAGPLSSDELSALEATLGAPILNTYGMSEASFIAGEPFPALHRVPGSVGLAQCEVRINDEQGAPLARHQTGEILIRGPRVFPGYLDDPAANAAAFLPGGWFRTGDLGFLDDAGYLHLTDRLGEVINRGGEKIVPREVDEVLLGHPAVADAAVFGVADARLGQEIVAAVVLRPAMAVPPRLLRAWLRARLARFKVPRRIWFVDELPRTPTGKVQRTELARRWDEAQGAATR
ncbi:MAG: AMP-binding protein [Thermomicrobiales bacterium]